MNENKKRQDEKKLFFAVKEQLDQRRIQGTFTPDCAPLISRLLHQISQLQSESFPKHHDSTFQHSQQQEALTYQLKQITIQNNQLRMDILKFIDQVQYQKQKLKEVCGQQLNAIAHRSTSQQMILKVHQYRQQNLKEELTQTAYKYNELMDLVHEDPIKERKYIKRLLKHKQIGPQIYFRQGQFESHIAQGTIQRQLEGKLSILESQLLSRNAEIYRLQDILIDQSASIACHKWQKKQESQKMTILQQEINSLRTQNEELKKKIGNKSQKTHKQVMTINQPSQPNLKKQYNEVKDVAKESIARKPILREPREQANTKEKSSRGHLVVQQSKHQHKQRKNKVVDLSDKNNLKQSTQRPKKSIDYSERSNSKEASERLKLDSIGLMKTAKETGILEQQSSLASPRKINKRNQPNNPISSPELPKTLQHGQYYVTGHPRQKQISLKNNKGVAQKRKLSKPKDTGSISNKKLPEAIKVTTFMSNQKIRQHLENRSPEVPNHRGVTKGLSENEKRGEKGDKYDKKPTQNKKQSYSYGLDKKGDKLQKESKSPSNVVINNRKIISSKQNQTNQMVINEHRNQYISVSPKKQQFHSIRRRLESVQQELSDNKADNSQLQLQLQKYQNQKEIQIVNQEDQNVQKESFSARVLLRSTQEQLMTVNMENIQLKSQLIRLKKQAKTQEPSKQEKNTQQPQQRVIQHHYHHQRQSSQDSLDEKQMNIDEEQLYRLRRQVKQLRRELSAAINQKESLQLRLAQMAKSLRSQSKDMRHFENSIDKKYRDRSLSP